MFTNTKLYSKSMFRNTIFASFSLLQKRISYLFSLFKKRMLPVGNRLLFEVLSEMVKNGDSS